MLCEIKDERQRTVVKGEFGNVFVEVTQGGHTPEGEPYQRFTNLVIRPVKRHRGQRGWEEAASVFLRLDEDAAEFLADALVKVSSRRELGLIHTTEGRLEPKSKRERWGSKGH